MFTHLRRFIFGSPLPTAEREYQRLGKFQALPVFSSDALSSVAYATEEILLVLVTAGALGLGLSVPIALAIAALLAIVAVSYYQTVHGYPSGGGAYIVAHENLGIMPGLAAAAALLIDYVLTVAVSVTAGAVAILSAFPELAGFRVELCLLWLAFIAVANLRGVRESGTLFALPTYGFVVLMLVLIATGLIRLAGGSFVASAEVPRTAAMDGTRALTLLLVLRAFASGCTALTGIEAISNGVGAFKKPQADNAGKTLLIMAFLLATMFLGITFLAHSLGVVPQAHESVVSQIGRQVFGGGWLYLALQIATALILMLAANTSFADFPRLSSILARDGYLPRQLSNLGDRLVYTNGIIVLAILAALLIVLFGGSIHRLIPLYAIGVFLSFTLSQIGMVRHWLIQHGKGWLLKAVINGLGAVTTGVVLLVIIESKFIHGAWIVLTLMPLIVWMFHGIHRHYLRVAGEIALETLPEPDAYSYRPDPEIRHKVVVPIAGLNRGSLGALRFARSLSRDVTAVLVDLDQDTTARIREQWSKAGLDVPLLVLDSPFRSVIKPFMTYLREVDQREPERGPAVVVLTEFVPARWWQNLLHNQTALLLKTALLYQRGLAGHDRVIIDVPYHLHR